MENIYIGSRGDGGDSAVSLSLLLPVLASWRGILQNVEHLGLEAKKMRLISCIYVKQVHTHPHGRDEPISHGTDLKLDHGRNRRKGIG